MEGGSRAGAHRGTTAVQATNDDVAASKLKLLVQFRNSERQGTDSSQKRKQIFSLGTGFDTAYFQLLVTSKKASIIDHYAQLREKLETDVSISREKGEVIGDHYKLFPVDIRDIEKLDAVIVRAQLDP